MDRVATSEKIAEEHLVDSGPHYALYHSGYDAFVEFKDMKFSWRNKTTFYISEPFFSHFGKHKNAGIYNFIIKEIEEIIVFPTKVYSFLSVDIRGYDVHYINMKVDIINGFKLINEI